MDMGTSIRSVDDMVGQSFGHVESLEESYRNMAMLVVFQDVVGS